MAVIKKPRKESPSQRPRGRLQQLYSFESHHPRGGRNLLQNKTNRNPTWPESSLSEISDLGWGTEGPITNPTSLDSRINEATSLPAVSTSSTTEPLSSTVGHTHRRHEIIRKVTLMDTNKKLLEEKLKALLPVFDFEHGPVAQTSELFALASTILGISDTIQKEEWLDMDELSQREIIMFLARHILRQVLRSYGYRRFCWTARQGVARLEIQPLPGEDPPEFPHWLQVPFLVPLKGTKLEIRREKNNRNSKSVRHSKALKAFKYRARKLKVLPYERLTPWTAPVGAPLLPGPSETYLGTLGAVMRHGASHYVLTAGHVIPQFANQMYALKGNDKVIPLEIMRYSDRYDNQAFRAENDSKEITSMCDLEVECGFLKIKQEDIWQFASDIPDLDCHGLRDYRDGFMATQDPFRALPGHPSRRHCIEQAIIKSQSTSNLPGLRVWKRGATTGLTQGYLVELLDSPPRDLGGWGQSKMEKVHNSRNSPASTESGVFSLDQSSDRESRSENDGYNFHFEDDDYQSSTLQDEFEWMGVVKWIDDYHPFAEGGDSGSLVFARKHGLIIPLGIHLGGYNECSLFLSIEVFCAVAEDRHLGDLSFPTSSQVRFKRPGYTRRQRRGKEWQRYMWSIKDKGSS